MIADAKAFIPPGVGGCVWHELASDRVRVSYGLGINKETTSWSRPRYGEAEATRLCLKWLWEKHSEATEQLCPYPQLEA